MSPTLAGRKKRGTFAEMGANANVTALGQLFDVGGRRLHAVISGSKQGKRPVVLEAGLTAMSSCWAPVQEELSRFTRVMAYDRAGLGWSDASPEPKDARSIAMDLHRLVTAADFPRPFVLVGHSMGGIFGRAYASMHPGDIAGMALVDASHPEQIERSPNIKSALRKFFWFSKGSPYMAGCGSMKSRQVLGFSWRRHMRTTALEAESWFTSAGQVKEERLGDLPLVTITAPAKCMPGWMKLQEELAGISTRGRHVVVDGASHLTILSNRDFAAKVADEVRAII